MAARGARAAAGDAGDRVPGDRIRPTRSRIVCAAFRQGLKDIGYIEGENVAIDYRWTENPNRSTAGAGGRIGPPTGRRDCHDRQIPLRAAKAATTTIPIVFIVAEDPVRLGLVPSLARPGGNLTGVNIFSAELVAKRLELLRELVPAATRVAVLVNPAMPRPPRPR